MKTFVTLSLRAIRASVRKTTVGGCFAQRPHNERKFTSKVIRERAKRDLAREGHQ